MTNEEKKSQQEADVERAEFTNSSWKKTTKSINRVVRKDATCVILLSGLVPTKEEP